MSATPRPGPSSPRAYTFPSVERATLANGLCVMVARIPRLPLVSVLALVDAGASRDAPGLEGQAALTAQALSEGTAHLDGGALMEQFELLGTGLETGSDWDDTTAQLTVTPARLERSVSLLGDVLIAPAFAPYEVERLKAERHAELQQQRMEPRGLADDSFVERVFVRGSRYAVPEGGSQTSITAIGVEHLRAFHLQHFVPGATALIFAGDVSMDIAVQLAERTMGAWRGGPASAPAGVDDATARSRGVHIVNKTGAPQTELRVGHRGLPRSHQDYFPVVVMNALLGGLFSSRINLNLRERNAFTYGARSGFAWRRGAGPFIVSTAVKSEVTGAATREIVAEIGKLRNETVSEHELSLATAYLDGVFPIRYETTSAVAEAIAHAHVYGLGEDYHTRYRERVRAVTASDVRRAAETYLHPDELLIVAVGDAATIRDPLERLELGPLSIGSTEPEEQPRSTS